MDTFADSMDGVRTTLLDWGWQGWDRGIWSLADGLLGLAGWGLFGSVWGDVKNGFCRLFQLGIVLVLCIVAHYVWAICWPIVSLVIAVLMTVVWIVTGELFG
jgi:hypothetical protein